MTMMVYVIVRLHGDEDWDAWGDKWWDHVEQVGELNWFKNPGVLDGPGLQLDWGAFLHEVSKEQIRRLAWEPDMPALSEWILEQRAFVDGLSSTDRYGLISVECY